MIIDEDWCDIFLRIKVNVKLVEAITKEDIAAITQVCFDVFIRKSNF